VHHADAKYYFPIIEQGKREGRTTPNADIMVPSSAAPTMTEMKFLIAPFSSQLKNNSLSRKQEGAHYGHNSLEVRGSTPKLLEQGLPSSKPILLKADVPTSSAQISSTKESLGHSTLSTTTPILLRAQTCKNPAVRPTGQIIESPDTVSGASSSTTLSQPPALYISVTTPLDVLAIHDVHERTFPTLFYKVPQKKPCDLEYKQLSVDNKVDRALVTMKVE
jgi:hypothetical protein